MKVQSRSKGLLLLALIVVPFLLAFTSAPTVRAASLEPSDVISVALRIALGFAALAGVSKLVPVIVQCFKVLGLAQDGSASRWAAGLNLLSFIALVLFGVFQPQLAIAVLDGYAGQIAEVLLFVLGLVMQLTGSKPSYDELKAADVPLLNFSHNK